MSGLDEGGEAPCWAHLFEEPTSDITDVDDVERLVVDFYRQAATDDVAANRRPGS
jgi:hypothetical protein